MSYIIDFGEDKTGIYGVEFNGSNPGTRLYDAKGLQFSPSNTTTAGRDDFITITDSPFAIKEVVTKYNSSTGKQEILAYEGDTNWAAALADTSHNVMIEFPKFYYRRPSRYRWEVSSIQHSGFKESPMHYRNGVIHDKIYVSKYITNSSFLSQSGTVPAASSTYTDNVDGSYQLSKFRTEFRNRGMYVLDYACMCSLNMLMIIKYASLNIQSVIGLGYTGFSSVSNTGGADNVKGKDGYSGSSINSYSHIVVMGIEDYYGNLWRWMDGIARKPDNSIWINTDIENLTQNPSLSNMGSFVKANTNIANSSSYNWIKDSIVYDQTFDWAMYPTSVVSIYGSTDLQTNPNYLIGDCYFYESGNSLFQINRGASYTNYYGAGIFAIGTNSSFGIAGPANSSQSIAFI